MAIQESTRASSVQWRSLEIQLCKPDKLCMQQYFDLKAYSQDQLFRKGYKSNYKWKWWRILCARKNMKKYSQMVNICCRSVLIHIWSLSILSVYTLTKNSLLKTVLSEIENPFNWKLGWQFQVWGFSLEHDRVIKSGVQNTGSFLNATSLLCYFK